MAHRIAACRVKFLPAATIPRRETTRHRHFDFPSVDDAVRRRVALIVPLPLSLSNASCLYLSSPPHLIYLPEPVQPVWPGFRLVKSATMPALTYSVSMSQGSAGGNAFSPLEQKLTCRLCKKLQHKFSSLSFSSHSLQALTLTLTRERRMSDTCLYTSSGAAKKRPACLPSFQWAMDAVSPVSDLRPRRLACVLCRILPSLNTGIR